MDRIHQTCSQNGLTTSGLLDTQFQKYPPISAQTGVYVYGCGRLHCVLGVILL